jgi:hypothetical protein
MQNDTKNVKDIKPLEILNAWLDLVKNISGDKS